MPTSARYIASCATLGAVFALPLPAIPGGDELAARWNEQTARHLYNRAAFGATREQVVEGARIGPAALVDKLLHGDARWERVEPQLFRWEDFGFDHHQMPLPKSAFTELSSKEQVTRCKCARVQERRDFYELQRRWFEAVLDSRDPVRDRMTLFWHELFTTSVEVNKRKFELVNQFQWLRANSLSSYSALLHGLVHDPAMLQYLDNSTNYKDHPNENLARELMELYSLGQGNYSERDVREAARALTGCAGGSDGRFEFLAEQHDDGTKTILGRTGQHGADELVDILLAQPACSRWVARRLLRSFEGVEPSEARLADYAAFLRDQQFAIEPFLRRLFLDPAFYRDEILGGRVSSPIEFLVGVCRALELRPSPAFVHRACSIMGQSLYSPPSVKGWPQGLEWINTDALMRRGNCVGALLGLDGAAVPAESLPATADAPIALDGSEMAPANDMEDTGAAPAVFVEPTWQPRAKLLGALRADKVASDAQIVDWIALRWLSMPPSPELRRLLVDYVASERSALGVAPGTLLDHSDAFDVVARKLAHLVFSLPEAQLL